LIIEIRVSTTIPKVAVLIPPAVDPGDPPTNINNIVKNFPAKVISAVETELNPAVLVVAEAKNALVNLSPKLIYLRVLGLLYSNTNIRIAPPIKRIAVIIITTLECKDNFLYPL